MGWIDAYRCLVILLTYFMYAEVNRLSKNYRMLWILAFNLIMMMIGRFWSVLK